MRQMLLLANYISEKLALQSSTSIFGIISSLSTPKQRARPSRSIDDCYINCGSNFWTQDVRQIRLLERLKRNTLPPLPYVSRKRIRKVLTKLCSCSSYYIWVCSHFRNRTFLKRAYPTMKKNNPHVPIMIREAMGVEPRIWARYGYGKEKMEALSGRLFHITAGPLRKADPEKRSVR